MTIGLLTSTYNDNQICLADIIQASRRAMCKWGSQVVGYKCLLALKTLPEFEDSNVLCCTCPVEYSYDCVESLQNSVLYWLQFELSSSGTVLYCTYSTQSFPWMKAKP